MFTPIPALRRTGRIWSMTLATGVLAATLAGCASGSDNPESGPAAAPAASGAAPIDPALARDFAGTFAAPPATAPTPQAGKNVWIVICGKLAPGCDLPAQAAKEAGTALGWNVTIADGNLGIGDGYQNAIRQAVAAKADAIVAMGIDCTNARGALQQAKDARIPTIALGSFDCDAPGAGGQPLYTARFQATAELPDYTDWMRAWGAAKARWLAHDSGGKAKVLLLHQEGILMSTYVNEGFRTEFAKCSGCEITDTVVFSSQELGTGVLKQKFSAALIANPQANAVVAPFDTTLQLGQVTSAVTSSGRKMTVVGGEGLPANLDNVLNRRGQSAVVAYSMGWLGYAGIDTVNRVLNGQPAVPQGWGWQTVDAAHPAVGSTGTFEPQIDYKLVYRRAWGLA